MRLLVLGGTRFVGRAIVEAALDRDWDVTVPHRGVSGVQSGVTALVADRTDARALRGALGDSTWDAVLDTWAAAPSVARDAAPLLAGRRRAGCR